MKIIKYYEYLYEIQELGFYKFKASEYLKIPLKNTGFKIQKLNKTSFYTKLKNSDEIVDFRTDIGALWYITDKKTCIKHTCRYNTHMPMLNLKTKNKIYLPTNQRA